MTRRFALAPLLALLGVGVVACSALVETSDLTGGGNGGDASTPQAEGGTPSNTGDRPDSGMAAEAAPPTDAGSCDQPDATAQTYCEKRSALSSYTYCRDFDGTDPIVFGWANTSTTDVGSIGLDTCRRTSAPASFRSRVEANAHQCTHAFVEKKITVGPVFSVQFDLRLVQVTVASTFYFGIALGGAGCTLSLIGNGASGAVFEESGTNSIHGLSQRFPLLDTWTRVELDIDRTNRTMNVLVDGKATMSNPITLGAACATTGDITLVVGLQCITEGKPAQEILFDNLLVQ